MNNKPLNSVDPNKRLKRSEIYNEKQQKNPDKRSLLDFFRFIPKIYSRGEINLSSIVVAYYVLMSLFPIIIIVGNVLPLLKIQTGPISDYLELILPAQIQEFIMPIIEELLSHPNSGLLSFGILIALWAFSRLVNALRISMNKIYGVQKDQFKKSFMTTLVNRGMVFIATGVLVFGLFLVLFVLVFGQQIIDFLAPIFHFSTKPFEIISHIRWPGILLTMFLIISYLYYFIPNVQAKKRSIFPGVIFTMSGWGLFSYGFSIYLHYFGTSWNNYGVVGTFIIFMLWLNFVSMVLLIGVVLNATIDRFKNREVDYQASRLETLFDKKTE